MVEADKLAESIKEQSRQEAQDEAAKIIAAATDGAKEKANRLLKRAEREISSKTEAALAEAQTEAQRIIGAGRQEAQAIVQSARDQLPGIESQAKLEAEYIVRRFTVQYVERLRSVVTEVSNGMLPDLDNLVQQTGHGSVLQDGAEAQAVIAPARARGKTSAKN